MVNNAAIAPEAQNPTPIYETALSVFDSTMLVNARGESVGESDETGNVVTVPQALGLTVTDGYVSAVSAVCGPTGSVHDPETNRDPRSGAL